MSVTQQWTPNAPANSDNPSSGDDEIRAFKLAVQQRQRNGGHIWETTTTTNTSAGRHACGVEQSEGGSGALAGEFYIYANDGTTRIVTIGDSSAASPSRFYAPTLNATFNNMTVGGTLTVTGVPTFTGNAIFNGTAEFNSTVQFDGAVTFNAAVTYGAAQVFNALASFDDEVRLTPVLINTTYSVLAGDTAILCTAASSYAVTLPLAASYPGKMIFIKIRSGAGTITLTRSGSDTIEGSTTKALVSSSGNADGAILISDGISNWSIISTRTLG